MKKIAFFSSNLDLGGVERNFLFFANNLSKDYDVSFLLKKKEGVLLHEAKDNVKIIEIGSSKLRYVFIKLVKLIKDYRFDYIISGTERTNTLAFFANICAGSPSKIITSQHSFVDLEASKLLNRFIIPFVHRHSYRVIAVSECIRLMLTRDMGVSSDKVHVIYNPVPEQQILELAECKVGPLPENYILYAGRFVAVKNLKYLIKGFSVFHEKNPQYYLLMVGDGPEKENLQRYASEQNVADYIKWISPTSNPYKLIKRANVIVITSFSESFSIFALESIILGKTVVSTPCKGPAEILQSPKYGYLTDSFNDANNLSELITQAIKKPISVDMLKKRAAFYNSRNSITEIKQILK